MKKGTALAYEWDMEETDEVSGDVLDHDHRWYLREYGEQAHYLVPHGVKRILVLVRDYWSPEGDLIDRTHAYSEGGRLPGIFENGMIVPQRFHKEIKSAPFCLELCDWGDEVVFRK